VDAAGKVIGRFRPTGIRPKIAKRISEYGVELPADLFDPNKIYE
jgi:pilus assembly protein CpaF